MKVLIGWAWRGLLALVGAVLVWQMVAEIVEPHWTLAPISWIFPRQPPLQAPSVGETVLRLYADARPHVGKITALQKGLVWVVDGRALIEEGYGLGCPILEIGGQAYNSREAQTEVLPREQSVRLIKRYAMDTIDTPIQFLQRKYQPVPSAGVVVFTYDIMPDGTIDVEVDFREVAVPWQRAYLMNEQGATSFPYYRDAQGTRLGPHQIGRWVPAEGAASCLENADGSLAFCVVPEPGSKINYGRERYLQYNWRGIYSLSWSGIDIVVEGPRPSYRYRIDLNVR